MADSPTDQIIDIRQVAHPHYSGTSAVAGSMGQVR